MRKPVMYRNRLFKDYEADIDGNVYRVGKSVPLKGFSDGRGYLVIDLMDKGHRCRAKLHQVIAHTFIGEQKPGTIVAHGDDNKRNNALKNLSYLSIRENIRDAQIRIKNIPYLTIPQRDEIKRLRKEGMMLGKIAEKMNLRYHVVRDLLYGKSYKYEEF